MANAPAKNKPKQKRPTALKRVDQSEKRQIQNRAVKSQIRTARRAFAETLEENVASGAQALNQAYSMLDKAVKKGVIKLGKASRLKSRMSAKLEKVQAS